MVFFCGREAELVEQDLAQLRRGVDVERPRPASSPDLARVSARPRPTSRSLSARSSARSTPTPTSSIRASTPTSGISMSSLSAPQALRVERRRAAARPGGRRPGARRRGRRAPASAVAVEVELALGGGVVRRAAASVGVAHEQLVEQVAASRPGRAGRRRSRVERRGRARRRRAPVERRASAAWRSWAASGRPPAGQRRERVAHRRRRRAARRAARPPRPAPPSTHDGQARRAASGPRRRPTPAASASGRSAAASASSTRDRVGRRRRARVDLGLEHLGARPTRRAEVGVERLGQPVVERAELEEVEQPPHLVDVELGRTPRSSRSTLERRRRARSTITSAFWRTCASCSARFCAQLRRLLVEVGEDAVEAAVGVDQLGRRLLPHAGHAGQVVGRVAAQRGVLRVAASGVTPVRSTMPASS